MKKLLAALVVAASPLPASAAIIHYTLQGATFADGGTATGGFDFDTVTFATVGGNITTAGGNLAGAVYATPYANYMNDFQVGFGDFAPRALFLTLANNGRFSTGGTQNIDPNSGGSFEFGGGVRNFASGSIVEGPAAAVPEPAMLGLFGLGAIGLGLSRRRKAA